MTMRHICSWQHHFTSEMIGIEETPYGVCFHCGKVRHQAKKLLLPLTADNVLCRMTCRTHRKKTVELCPNKAEESFKIPDSQKSLPDILQDTHESNWRTLPIQGRIVLQIYCFTEKFARYSGCVGWRWMPQGCRRNFGWLSRQSDDSVIARVLEVVCNALFVYSNNIILLGLSTAGSAASAIWTSPR